MGKFILTMGPWENFLEVIIEGIVKMIMTLKFQGRYAQNSTTIDKEG